LASRLSRLAYPLSMHIRRVIAACKNATVSSWGSARATGKSDSGGVYELGRTCAVRGPHGPPCRDLRSKGIRTRDGSASSFPSSGRQSGSLSNGVADWRNCFSLPFSPSRQCRCEPSSAAVSSRDHPAGFAESSFWNEEEWRTHPLASTGGDEARVPRICADYQFFHEDCFQGTFPARGMSPGADWDMNQRVEANPKLSCPTPRPNCSAATEPANSDYRENEGIEGAGPSGLGRW
jgi:hypothetical protein